MIRLATIPSPAQGVWHLGPIPLRAYAFCILLGIAVAIVLTQRRWKARGGDPVVVVDIATWAVPFGVVGGRIYHVITSPQAYFGENGEPIKALYIWQGGLGIWGAVVLGGVGAWIGCRRHGVRLPPFADALAPGVVLAQAVGRWGNWFNNELYGRATDLPWALQVHEWDSSAGRAVRDAAGEPVVLGTFHPAFLYESIWDVFTALVLIFADRRWKLGHGRVFALYVAVYSLGRGWIEALRIDDANLILGQRLNVWTSLIVFLGGLTYFIVSARLRPGRETVVMRSAGLVVGSDGAPEGSTVGESAEAVKSDSTSTNDGKSTATDPAGPVGSVGVTDKGDKTSPTSTKTETGATTETPTTTEANTGTKPKTKASDGDSTVTEAETQPQIAGVGSRKQAPAPKAAQEQADRPRVQP